jgi:hypothetical protein
MRLRAMNEVRRTADSRKGESGAKPEVVAKHRHHRGAIQWVETECPEAQVREPRIPVRVRNGAGRSQSPHSSGEAGNDRGAKEDRKVEA